MAKRPIPSARLDKELSLENLAEDVLTLMEMGLNKQQSLSTLALFPKREDAIRVTESYNTLPKEERPVSFTSYNDYLESLRTAILGSTEIPTLYDQEVGERTVLVPRSALEQTSYRDKPQGGSHFYEHQASQLDA